MLESTLIRGPVAWRQQARKQASWLSLNPPPSTCGCGGSSSRQGPALGRPPALSTPSFLHPLYRCPAEQTNDALPLKQTQLVPVHGLWPLPPLPPFVSFSHPSAAFIRKRPRMSFQRPFSLPPPLACRMPPCTLPLPHSHTPFFRSCFPLPWPSPSLHCCAACQTPVVWRCCPLVSVPPVHCHLSALAHRPPRRMPA